MFCIYYDNGLNGTNQLWGKKIYSKPDKAWESLMLHIDRLRNNPGLNVYQDTNEKKVVLTESLRRQSRCVFWIGEAEIV